MSVGVLVKAWGEIGHEIVANIAWSRLDDDPQLQMHLRKILNVTQSDTTTPVIGNVKEGDHLEGDHLDDNISFHNGDEDPGSPFAEVANWADHVRHFLPWSGQLHFIDVQDEIIDGGCHYHPHHDANDDSHFDGQGNNDKCLFFYERDCVDNECVAGAILNYSTQLLPAVMDQKHQMEKQQLLLGLDGHRQAIQRHRQRRSLRGQQNVISMNGDYFDQTNVTFDPYHQKQALMFLIQ